MTPKTENGDWRLFRTMQTRISKALEHHKLIAIMGCSAIGCSLARDLRKMNEGFGILFFDNDPEKQGKAVEGCSVIKPQKRDDIELYIIASTGFHGEMEKQLAGLGISQKDIFFLDEVWRERERRRDVLIKKRKAKKELNFVMDLAEHCNLGCQNCDHFSPLAKEHFTDIGEFRSDIRRMAELFLGGGRSNITHVDLEGGEPLLNPNVTDYIEVVHQHLPETTVKIFTNGLLLDRQPQKFWDICREHAVVLEVTKYPVKFDYHKIECTAESNGVRMEYYSGGNGVKTSTHKPLDLSGKQDKYDSFHKCYMGNGDCPMLKHGHLYPCTVIPNISTFNEYFHQCVEVCGRDSIDIYKAETAEEILDFLANPVPACRYCQPDKWTGGHEWKRSAYKMSEWAE